MRAGNSFFCVDCSIRSTGSTTSWMSSESGYTGGASIVSEGSNQSFVMEVSKSKSKTKNKIAWSSLWDGNNVNSLTLEIQTFAMIRFEPSWVDATLVLNVSRPLMKLSKTLRCLSCEIWRWNLIPVNELFNYGNYGWFCSTGFFEPTCYRWSVYISLKHSHEWLGKSLGFGWIPLRIVK
jgi:hypothetical protein